MGKAKQRQKMLMECYSIAAPLLLAPDIYTEGQRDRLTEVLLNALSDPDRYRVRVVRNLARMAVKP